MYDIKMQRKLIKEMSPDQLGVKAIDDYTLEVELQFYSISCRFNGISNLLSCK